MRVCWAKMLKIELPGRRRRSRKNRERNFMDLRKKKNTAGSDGLK